MRNNRAEPQFGYQEPVRGQPNREVYPTLENAPRRRRRSLIPVTITGMVIILFAAALWITYTGHKRGANGEPPLIMADETPVKVKPEQPGGMNIPYQNTTVYDQLATGKQKQEPGVEHLLQPPEQPLPKPVAAPETSPTLPAGPAQDTAEVPAPAINDDPAALAPMPVPVAPVPAQTAPPHQIASTPPPAMLSPPPPSKPVPAQQLAATTPAPKPASASIVATPAAGTGFMLQLGAFHDEATANSDWQSTKAAHPAELAGLRPTVEKVGDKALYRLKAGPLAEAQARANCTALKAANVVCIVVPQ